MTTARRYARRATALAALSFAVLAPSLPATAHSYKLGALSIGHIWMKPAVEDAAAAGVFGALLNGGGEPLTLRGVSTPAAGRAGICATKNGTTEWRESLVIEPQSVVAMAPWRAHICLSDLDRAFAEGETVPLTLDFGAAGAIDIEIAVEPEAGH